MADTTKQETNGAAKTAPRRPRRESKSRSATARRPAAKASASRRKANRSGNGMAAGLMNHGRSALTGANKWVGEMPRALKGMHVPDQRSLQAMANDRPLLLGAVGLGIGMLIGALLPAMHGGTARPRQSQRR